MKFAAFTTVAESAGEATNAADLLDNLRQETILAEELGYDAMWLGEHHFGPYAAGDIPNPILLGADLAARTSRIRIGQMANIAPWWHPIRLAEDVAILDNLTRGRIEVGFGRGIWPYEGPQFHPNADPRKDEENRTLFRETIEVAREVWTNEYFSYKGENYNFPAEDTRFSHPLYPPDPRWLEGRPGDETACHSEALPKASPATVDDRVDRQVGDHGGRARIEGMLLAAPGFENQAADGAVRGGAVKEGWTALHFRRGPGGDADDVRVLVHGTGPTRE